jgi:hypothetical protein
MAYTGNTLLTPHIIAQEALIALEANMVMPTMVHRDYSDEFHNVGDTITVRKPPIFVAKPFTGSIDPQNITETSVDVSLDTLLDVSVELAPTDLTLRLTSFTEKITMPAMRAIAQAIDTNLCNLYQGIPYFYGTAGRTPNSLLHIASARKVMNLNWCPMSQRSLVLDPSAEASISILEGIVNTEKSGSSEALREAIIGRIYGFDTASDQNVAYHTAGIPGGTPTATGSAGNLSVTIAGGGDSGYFNQGDLITFAGLTGNPGPMKGDQYVVTADTPLSIGGAGTLPIYPALTGDITGALVTLVASHQANLAFHENALGMVTRPLALPAGMEAISATVQNPQTGIAIRVIYGFTQATKVQTISFDCLVGFKVLYPELACRLLG